MGRSQAILLVSTAARFGLALGITAVVGRCLSEADFGFYTLAGTLYFLAHILMDLGSGSVAMREIVRTPEREKALLETLVGARAVAGAVLGAVVLAWALTEDSAGRKIALAAVALSFPLLAPGALVAALQVRQAQGAPAVVGVAAQAGVLAGASLLAFAGAPGSVFVGLVIVREVTNAWALRRIAARRLGWSAKPRLGGPGLGPFFRAALVQGAAVLLHAAYFHVDVFLVRAILGESALGAYAAAYRPVTPLLSFPGVLMLPVLPVIAAAAGASAAAAVPDTFRRATRALAGVGALGGVAGAVLAPDLLSLLYGGRFQSGPTDAVPAFRWMSAAFACVFAAAPYTTCLVARGRERTLVVLAALALALNLAGNLVLLPRMGIEAAAIVTAATEFLVLVLAAGAVGRDLGWSLPLGALRAAALGGISAILLWFVPGPHAVRAGAGIAVGLAGAAWFLGAGRPGSGIFPRRP